MSAFVGRGLCCRRGEREVFARLAFGIAPGEVLLVKGPNGSGKSSLLRLMAGLLRPTEGRVEWHGADIAADPDAHRRRLHFIGHQDAVKPALTVRENLAFWAILRGEEAPGRITAALGQLGLEPFGAMPARLLSAGQRRRLALARLLATPAALWLLDEPVTALDEESVTRFGRMLDEHRAGGGCAVLAVHGAIDAREAQTLVMTGFPPGIERSLEQAVA